MQKLQTNVEKDIDSIIKECVEPFVDRVELFVGYDEDNGVYWRITPKNSQAAPICIYGVGKDVINIDVDKIYWIELFGDDRKVAIFRAHLEAVFEGRAVSWHDSSTLGKTRVKTLLEVDTGQDKPYQWTGNIILPSRFKGRRGVIKKEYQRY